MAVHPLVGGVSVNLSKNLASYTLKGPRVVKLHLLQRSSRNEWLLIVAQ